MCSTLFFLTLFMHGWSITRFNSTYVQKRKLNLRSSFVEYVRIDRELHHVKYKMSLAPMLQLELSAGSVLVFILDVETYQINSQ